MPILQFENVGNFQKSIYKDLHGGSYAIAWTAITTSVYGFPTTFKLRRGIAVPRFRCF